MKQEPPKKTEPEKTKQRDDQTLEKMVSVLLGKPPLPQKKESPKSSSESSDDSSSEESEKASKKSTGRKSSKPEPKPKVEERQATKPVM